LHILSVLIVRRFVNQTLSDGFGQANMSAAFPHYQFLPSGDPFEMILAEKI
jgi:hypothetical protein